MNQTAIYICIFKNTLVAWFNNRGASKGAALSFYALFSIAPILVLSIVVAGFFFGEEAAKGQIVNQIDYLVGKNGAIVIQAIISSATNHEEGQYATFWAVIFLFIGASSVFSELKASLDEIWGTDRLDCQPVSLILRTRLLSFGLVLVLTFLLLISLIITAGISVIGNYTLQLIGDTLGIYSLMMSLFSFSVVTFLFAVIYKMLPDKKLAWWDVIVGSIFTSILFTLGKYLIGVYLSHSAVASSFGAASSVIAFILWIYYSAQIFFIGAEFTKQYEIAFGRLDSNPK
jgi:membrane protein